MTPEERLLRALFTKSEQGEQDGLDEMPDNYPETVSETESVGQGPEPPKEESDE